MLTTVTKTLRRLIKNSPFGCLSRLGKMAEELEKTQRALRESEAAREWEMAIGLAISELQKPLILPESTIGDMACKVLEQSLRLSDSALGYVLSVNRTSGETKIHACTSVRRGQEGKRFCKPRIRVPRDSGGVYMGLRGHALNTGEAFFINDARSHPAFQGVPDWHAPIRRFLAVPVVLDGKPAGQIVLANPTREYRARDLKAVQRVASLYALALQRKEAQERTVAALQEKEVLLREVHHRVKNNLQVVSSLLNLQAGRVDDPAALEMLKESQNRVRSMALVHEQLHRSRDLSRINVGEYIRNLTASLFSSYGITSKTIALRLDVEEAGFGIDAAVPCGLIIQELVSNSLKHAFPNGRSGEVRVVLRCPPEGGWKLTVADDGAGLPEGLDLANSTSLGLRLVRILADQLDAQVRCLRGAGTTFEVEFKEPDNN